jgi:hypothetical protein
VDRGVGVLFKLITVGGGGERAATSWPTHQPYVPKENEILLLLLLLLLTPIHALRGDQRAVHG